MVEVDLRRTIGNTHQLLRQLSQEEDDLARVGRRDSLW